MDEERFRSLVHATIGEPPTPPDLQATAYRALNRPVERRPSAIVGALAAVASVLLVVGIIGFNLLSHHRPGSASLSPGPSPAASPAGQPTPAPSPSPSGVEPCTADKLTVAPGGSQGAAGHIFLSFALTNSSTVVCTMSGFPSAQLLDSGQSFVHTRVVGQGGQLSNTPGPVMFQLSPGQRAAFQVSWGDVPVGNETCNRATTIEFGPPGAAASAALAVTNLSITICNSGELDASALVASS